MTADATLYYGYYLGCPESGGWEVKEASEFGELDLPWIVLADEDHKDGDYQAAMTLALLSECGADSAQTVQMSYQQLKDLLAQHCGVAVVQHGHPDYPRYGLAAAGSVARCVTWEPLAVAPSLGADAHRDLAKALELLRITPHQANPTWLLAPGEH